MSARQQLLCALVVCGVRISWVRRQAERACSRVTTLLRPRMMQVRAERLRARGDQRRGLGRRRPRGRQVEPVISLVHGITMSQPKEDYGLIHATHNSERQRCPCVDHDIITCAMQTRNARYWFARISSRALYGRAPFITPFQIKRCQMRGAYLGNGLNKQHQTKRRPINRARTWGFTLRRRSC